MPRTTSTNPANSAALEEITHDVVEVNCETGAVTYRAFTDEERAAREATAQQEWTAVPSEADELRAQLAALTARLEAAGL